MRMLFGLTSLIKFNNKFEFIGCIQTYRFVYNKMNWRLSCNEEITLSIGMSILEMNSKFHRYRKRNLDLSHNHPYRAV